MNEIVFLEPRKIGSIPFTTSKVIAEMTGIEHRKIKAAIRKHREDLESFGLSASYQAESSGGRPEEIVKLNEEQATFLMTLLKNTPIVVAFKKELVRQFYAMRKQLVKNAIARETRKPTRRELTDVIRDCVPVGPHKAMMYKNYTDLAYKIALGKNAAQLRKERNAPKGSILAEYLTAEETEAVKKAETKISILVESGMDYQAVKAIMCGNFSGLVAKAG